MMLSAMTVELFAKVLASIRIELNESALIAVTQTESAVGVVTQSGSFHVVTG
jgi:hypothetical protein